MKALTPDGSDAPKIFTNNTAGYESPGCKGQAQEIKDKERRKNRPSFERESEQEAGLRSVLSTQLDEDIVSGCVLMKTTLDAWGSRPYN